tara:strand:+ start:436 stop:1032 length:597 start_codon:yes stop_codon:yes gene_type:complete
MKKPIITVLSIFGMYTLSAFANVVYFNPQVESFSNILHIKEANLISSELKIVEVKLPEIKTHIKFLDDIGFRESSNNYKAVNQFGYLGKYQFGRKTLNNLGYEDVSNREFLENSSIQEEAMYALLNHNKRILRRQIKKYHGKTIYGVYITESGILAAAHLAGAGNVRKFFRKGYEFKDGNGTKMTSYMILFSGYKLEF